MIKLAITCLLTVCSSFMFAQINGAPGSLTSPFDAQSPDRFSDIEPYDYGHNVRFFYPEKDVEVLQRSPEGKPLAFKAEVPQDEHLTWEQKADLWLADAAELMRIENAELTFKKRDLWTDAQGTTHMRLDQYHNGAKVFGAEIILHSEGGKWAMQNGPFVPQFQLPILARSAGMNASQLKEVVISELENYQENWQVKSDLPFKEVEQWTDEPIYYNHEGNYRLSHHFLVMPNMKNRYEYIVDASTGEVLNQWSTTCQLHHEHTGACTHAHTDDQKPLSSGPTTANAQDLLGTNRVINTFEENGTFFLIDGSRASYNPSLSSIPDEPIGAIWTIDIGGQSPINSNASFRQITSGSNNWSSTREGVSAHYNAGEAYEYFERVHGRNGITGDGQTIVSVVNVTNEDGSSMGNAFYNSLAIWYGNGDNTFFPLGRALDVAGHELTHGVVENTANLIYQNESGAMNESFADIFGAMIDRDDWLIGEDVVRPGVFPGGALRSLSDPHNGANFQDLARGWQPSHYDERFRGSEDNGGVHINSGIPNHAFYRFAQVVGRERAEQVFYRALTTYLTRSSNFQDLRFSVEQSAVDLYGNSEADAASQAFAAVGIAQSTVPDYERDIEVNQGSDLLLHTDVDRNTLFVGNLNTGEIVFNPLSTTPMFSRPSVRDDGSQVIFVGQDNFVYLINIDWSTNPPRSEEIRLDQLFGGNWYNAVISKDGNRVALIENADVNEIVLYDDIIGQSRTYTLFNPSYSDGVMTGEVVFADAMEFDHTGNILMYDALNRVESVFSDDAIENWDIGFLNFWDGRNDTWASGDIDKLFGSLPENVSIGNPTFTKNSPHIVAFDVRTENSIGGFDFEVNGMNIEAGVRQRMFSNGTFSYPNYSRDDEVMVADITEGEGPESFPEPSGIASLRVNEDKISTIANSESVVVNDRSWGVWFTNGVRELPTSTEEIITEKSSLSLSPIPASTVVHVSYDGEVRGTALVELMDMQGRVLNAEEVEAADLTAYPVQIGSLSSGAYVIRLHVGDSVIARKFVKE